MLVFFRFSVIGLLKEELYVDRTYKKIMNVKLLINLLNRVIHKQHIFVIQNLLKIVQIMATVVYRCSKLINPWTKNKIGITN